MHRYDILLAPGADDALTLLSQEIPEGSRVLELGCGNGRFSRYLAGEKGCRVSIVDYDSFLFQKASPYAKDGICADLMGEEWKEYYRQCRFDRIVLADVLEHLQDPETLLKACISFLAKDGCLLLSVPNFAHNDILLQLYRDDLPKADTGIMDYTHITMFTRQGLSRLLSECGYKAEKIEGVVRGTGETEQLAGREIGPEQFVEALETRQYGHVYQWVIRAVPLIGKAPMEENGRGGNVCGNHPGGSIWCGGEMEGREAYCLAEYRRREKDFAALNRKHAALKKKLADRISGNRELEGRISALEEERLQILQVSRQRDDNIQHLQRVTGNMRLQQEQLQKEAEELRREVQSYKNSASWKITAPFRMAGRVFRRFCGREEKKKTENKEESRPEKDEGPADWQGNRFDMADGLWHYDKPLDPYRPLVSVIIPCYQHAVYLEERLNSVMRQTYDRMEVILLDDGSSDGSRELLAKWAGRFPDARVCFNEKNSGSVFSQWNRGILMARGSLIWIAESDDTCRTDFLEKLIPLMAHECVMLAFTGSDFLQNGKVIGTSEEYLSEIKGFTWNRDFILPSPEFVKSGFGVKNMIPNVSGCIFRNTGKIRKELAAVMEKMKLCGDWLFYLDILRGGCVGYSSGTRNFYRVHQDSTSLKVQRTNLYYQEYGEVLRYAARWYPLCEENLNRVIDELTEHYMTFRNTDNGHAKEEVLRLLSLPGIRKEAEGRRYHILMCGYSLRAGGGETFAIYLANQLKQDGFTLTFMDYGGELRDDRIRGLLRPDIPLLALRSTDDLMQVMSGLGADIVHTHHASVDGAVAAWLRDCKAGPAQVVTFHGMYETMKKEDVRRTLRLLSYTCGAFVYIADKNLEPLRKSGVLLKQSFEKIENALPRIDPAPVSRQSLGISEEDFVCVLASRGIPEKGWQEAVHAVHMANRISRKAIRLVILGEGEMRFRLEKKGDPWVMFLGVRENVRDYFSMGDVGLLPTFFKGESSPLTVIECLQSGRPMIVTDIGEARNQLADENGMPAGCLLHLQRGRVSVKELSGILADLAGQPEEYRVLQGRCESAAKKFDMENASKRYANVYQGVLS